MRFSIFAFVTALCAASGSLAENAKTSWWDGAVGKDAFFGTWTGDVSELEVEASYPVVLRIFERYGRVYQNSRYGAPYECNGGGVLIEEGSGMLHLNEIITKNRGTCSDGTMRVYLSGADSLKWEWFYPDGTFAAKSELVRRK